MGAADVHVNRAPLDGVVTRIEYRKGSHLPAFPGQATNNQQNRIWLETIDGEVELRQITGTIVREIICYVRPGDQSGSRRKDRHDSLRLSGGNDLPRRLRSAW